MDHKAIIDVFAIYRYILRKAASSGLKTGVNSYSFDSRFKSPLDLYYLVVKAR